MADNIDVTPGTGKTVAADDIGGVLHQRVKVVLGADATSDGDVSSANPMPVSDAGGSLTVDGTVATSNFPSTVDTNSGNKSASTVRVVLATDQPALTNKLLVTPDLPSGASTAAKQPALGTAGTPSADVITVQGVTSMTALKVDGTGGSFPVTDSGGSLTVDYATTGSGTATGALRVELPTNGTGVIATVGAVTSITNPLPAGTNAIGKLSANSGVDIGDVDVTTVGTITPGTAATSLGKAEDAAHSSGDTGVYALAVRDDVPAAHSGTDGDYESLHTNRDGMLWVTPGPQESDLATQATTHVKKYYTNAGAVTDGIIWSPAAGKRWYVTDIFINVSAAATVTLEDDLAGGDSPVWKAELAANSGWSHSFETPLYSGEDAADLLITTSAGNVYVTVTGYEI